MGDAAKVADYESLKKRILASRYTMNFQSGVNFDLSVLNRRFHDRSHALDGGKGRNAI